MSRDIKFRAWDGRKLIYSNSRKGVERLGWFFANTKGMPKDQFTELTDKNGVDIYGGDVLPDGIDNLVVTFNEYNDCEEYQHFKHYGWNVFGTPLVDAIKDGCIVIGNIHQHPELSNNPRSNKE